jgi:hypothetical protein
VFVCACVRVQLVLEDLCAGVEPQAPCYSVMLSVHRREQEMGGAELEARGGAKSRAKHSNRFNPMAALRIAAGRPPGIR